VSSEVITGADIDGFVLTGAALRTEAQCAILPLVSVYACGYFGFGAACARAGVLGAPCAFAVFVPAVGLTGGGATPGFAPATGIKRRRASPVTRSATGKSLEECWWFRDMTAIGIARYSPEENLFLWSAGELLWGGSRATPQEEIQVGP
jgi:hypothetical protein